jgi:hypothetical protein
MQEGERDGDDEKRKFAGTVPKARAENFANGETSDVESDVELKAQKV